MINTNIFISAFFMEYNQHISAKWAITIALNIKGGTRLKNNYHFGSVKLSLDFNSCTLSMPYKFYICFSNQNLILFQLFVP